MFLDRKLIHSAPITDMSSYKHNLVSCDESGCAVLSQLDCGELMIVARTKIFGGLVVHIKLSNFNLSHHLFHFLYNYDEKWKLFNKIGIKVINHYIFRQPCTTTEMTRTGLIVVGYGCGTIRVFDPAMKITGDDAEDQLPTIVQVSAHARCITSMSAAKDADLLLTVSEDSWIRVWRVNSTVILIKS